MGVEIKSENIDVGGNSVLLVSVKSGLGVIGTCSAGYNTTSRADNSGQTRVFYIGSEPVVNMVCPNHGDKRTDKLISFCPGFQSIDAEIRDKLTEDFQKLNRGDSLEAGLREVFSLLADGVYTVYVSDYYPTDGSGVFFWGAYNISHEIHGSADYNHTVGANRPYRPCFLIPSQPLNQYLPKIKAMTDEAAKTRRIQGIVYHLAGFHSVLLKGHHGAVSCVEAKIPFKCAVIEKVTEPYTDPVLPVVFTPPPAEGDAAAETDAAAAPAPAPVPVKREGITGFRSASVKIPLEVFPKDMLRQLIESRAETKPEHYNILTKKLSVVRKKAVSNNVIPRKVLERCETLPDCEMVESAFAVDNLTDEQLNALLAGDTEYNGEIIISPNFYASVVTACNFLQFHDEKRFLDFAFAILGNYELYATHEYTARRISRLATNQRVYKFFKDTLASGEPQYEKFAAIADRFVKDYEAANK